AQAAHRYFHENGYYWVNTPVITTSDAEGAGQMFRVSTLDLANLPRGKDGTVDFDRDFFGKETFLTVSGQLNVEAFCLSMSKVYTFGPTFRAENSHTTRHLAEFWMIEPEIAFADLAEIARVSEEFLKYLFKAVLDERADDMAFIAERVQKDAVTRLESFINAPFERIEYSDAVKLLQDSGHKFDFPVEWGLDLQTEHERWLTEQHVGRPVVVTNYPEHIKAFYMRLNDDGRTVAALDVLAPGIGEIIGGSQREERLGHRRLGAGGAPVQARRALGPVRPRPRALRLVPRLPPLRHRPARGLRPGLRAPDRLRLRPVQHPRRHPLPARSGHGGVLRPCCCSSPCASSASPSPVPAPTSSSGRCRWCTCATATPSCASAWAKAPS